MEIYKSQFNRRKGLQVKCGAITSVKFWVINLMDLSRGKICQNPVSIERRLTS